MKTLFIAAAAALASVAAQASIAVMCKMPTCKSPAVEKSQFCERHTCATAGCTAGVKIGGVPGWAQGNTKKNAFYGAPTQSLPTRIVWRHCPKHVCGRLAPRLANDSVSSLFANKDQDELLKILACDQERLFKGKYCLRHSCGVANCASGVFEEWSQKARKNQGVLELSDLSTQEFCPRHLSQKGNNKLPREGLTKETCSENYQRKQAEKQLAKEKEAAKK